MSNTPSPVFSTDVRIPVAPQIDSKDLNLYNDLSDVHAAIRLLQQYLDLYTGSRIICRAHVNISIGQFVSIAPNYSDLAGANLADNSNYLNPCIGFATEGSPSGNGIEIQTFGVWQYGNGLLVPGTIYYLGTNGGITPTVPVAAGKLAQYVGFAVDSNNLLFHPAAKYKEL